MTHIPVPTDEEPFTEDFDDPVPLKLGAQFPEPGTMVNVRAVERTVDDLLVLLGDMPADAKVALQTRHGEAEEFTVEYDEDSGWVILAG